MAPLGRFLVLVGVVTLVLGLILLLASRVPLLGRLPGDFRFERDGLTIYVPLATSLLLSLLATLLINLFFRR